ncbi:unnamed protein product [Symbiodinium sp. KB8]|nr:unnamed protein product [Symbiodinium sp. KB8]
MPVQQLPSNLVLKFSHCKNVRVSSLRHSASTVQSAWQHSTDAMVGAPPPKEHNTSKVPAWEDAQELVALDRLRFQHLHRVLYAHRQRVENANSYYDVFETERQTGVLLARSEAMRISRARRKEEETDSLNRDNQRLVERLGAVMRESEGRRRQILAPKPPSSAPAGSLNLTLRRKAARQIDKDNKVLLDRLVRIGPTVSGRAELASRYEVYTTLVNRHSRLRRTVSKADVFRTPPPPIRQPRFRKPKRARAEAPLLPLPAVVKSAKEEPAPDARPETPEPLHSARKAAQKEVELVGQHVLNKLAPEDLDGNADASGTQKTRADTVGSGTYSEYDFDSEDADARSGTPEPKRSAKQAAQNELELVEKKVLQKIHSEGAVGEVVASGAAAADAAAADPGASFNAGGTYSDFEGSDGEARAAAESQGEDSEYEDDCEAEDAYSDTFEVEDADEEAEEAESEANSPRGNIAGNIIGNIVGSVSATADPQETGAATGHAISEPSDSASRYSEPEEAPIAEAEEPESEYSENLEAEVSESDRDSPDRQDGDGRYYTPSDASDPDAGVDVRQSSIASYDDDGILEEDSGESLHPPGVHLGSRSCSPQFVCMVSARQFRLGALLALGLSTSAEDPGLLAEVARLKAEVERLKTLGSMLGAIDSSLNLQRAWARALCL